MRSLRMLAAIICGLMSFGQRTTAQTTDKNSFERRMYSIEAISHFGIDEQKFANLTESDKRNLFECRDDLIGLLRAIQTKRNAMAYVTSDLVRKYGNTTALAANLLEPETSLLAAGVSDFDFVDTRTVKLQFFVAVFSEGDVSISEKSAILKRTDLGWRIAALE